ncbi:MAG: hypothetical protein R2825_25975 [Saprospiraceae bacterium]
MFMLFSRQGNHQKNIEPIPGVIYLSFVHSFIRDKGHLQANHKQAPPGLVCSVDALVLLKEMVFIKGDVKIIPNCIKCQFIDHLNEMAQSHTDLWDGH